jgi:hypothetical protein
MYNYLNIYFSMCFIILYLICNKNFYLIFFKIFFCLKKTFYLYPQKMLM